MNILVLIRELDNTSLEREVRNGDAHGEIITYYNETDDDVGLVIDSVEYLDIIQVCLILKDSNYYIYIQHGESPSFVKLNIDSITEITLKS